MDVKDAKDRRLVSDIVIDDETYQNLLDMLNSTEEDAIVALTTINNLNKNKNLIPILFLRKEANCSKELWKQHCIKHLNHHNKNYMSADIKYITYADIFKILNEVVFSSKKEKEQVLTFYTKRLESFITRNLVGFEDIVDKVYINIKLKGDDK